MFAKILDTLEQVNSRTPKLDDKYYTPKEKPHHRLSQSNFYTSQDQRRQWIKDFRSRVKLRTSEPLVLEALAFNLDAAGGYGHVTIEKLRQSELLKDYCSKTITNSLNRLAKKGAITKVRGPCIKENGKWTSRNYYTLVGYQFKFPDQLEVSSDNLSNTNKNINTYHTEAEIYDNDFVNLLPEKQKSLPVRAPDLEKRMKAWKIWDARQLIVKYGEAKCEKAYKLSKNAHNPGGHMRVTLQNMEDNIVIPANSCATEIRSIGEEKIASLIDSAHEALKQQGVYYPSLGEKLSGSEFYKRASEYGLQHTAMLKQLSSRI